MLLLTTVKPTFNKGTLKKMLRFGLGGGGGRRYRKSWAYLRKILTTHLLKPETEQQESLRNVLSYHFDQESPMKE